MNNTYPHKCKICNKPSRNNKNIVICSNSKCKSWNKYRSLENLIKRRIKIIGDNNEVGVSSDRALYIPLVFNPSLNYYSSSMSRTIVGSIPEDSNLWVFGWGKADKYCLINKIMVQVGVNGGLDVPNDLCAYRIRNGEFRYGSYNTSMWGGVLNTGIADAYPLARVMGWPTIPLSNIIEPHFTNQIILTQNEGIVIKNVYTTPPQGETLMVSIDWHEIGI